MFVPKALSISEHVAPHSGELHAFPVVNQTVASASTHVQVLHVSGQLSLTTPEHPAQFLFMEHCALVTSVHETRFPLTSRPDPAVEGARRALAPSASVEA